MTLIFAPEGRIAQALGRALRLERELDGPWLIHGGQVGRYEVVLLETERGKVAAAAAVAYARQRFNPSQAFGVGLAQALDPQLKPLDLIVAQDGVQYDLAFEAPTEHLVAADPVLSQRVLRAAQALGQPVRTGRVATADRSPSSPAEVAHLRERLAADVAETGGAAALWSARKTGIPLALIRMVGDAEHLEPAARHLAELMVKVLEG